MILKLAHILLFALAAQELLPRREQIFNRNDILVGMNEADSTHSSERTPPPQEFVAHFGAYQTGLSVVA